MNKWKTFTEVCPVCEGTGETTLYGTFKKHKCACKNGTVKRIVKFDIIDVTDEHNRQDGIRI